MRYQLPDYGSGFREGVEVKPYYEKDGITIYHGDCREILATLPANCVDSVVTDPPYGLKFMGKKWDYDVPGVEVWKEALRVLKPGGHLLIFAGTRTQHRMAVNIEDAGFEIRDMIAWVYGSGFPKSLDVSKAIDKAAGAEREVVGKNPTYRKDQVDAPSLSLQRNPDITAPATDAARQWNGWGTALKPALEPITVARKPFKGTVAGNVLEHGTGALNIDGCRVGTESPEPRNAPKKIIRGGRFHSGAEAKKEMSHYNPTKGRWPANLIHDGSEEVVGLFPETKSGGGNGARSACPNTYMSGDNYARTTTNGQPASSGSAARFFYCAKASRKERGEGNTHPTVKPLALMRYLVRLVTPPGGVVLDPFMGSGTTLVAAKNLGHKAIGVDIEERSCEIAAKRLAQGVLL
jgi:DNA modification methylase